MYRSAHELSAAASQVRSAAAAMNRIVADMQSATVWSGDDVDRFVDDWNTRVSTPLYLAASRMDAVDFTEAGT